MTKTLIVVESYFGSIQAIAEAVATGLIENGIEAQIIDVTRAPSALSSGLDLLALGAPTHNWHLLTTTAWTKVREQAASEEASLEIGERLETVAIPASIDATVFDTVISKD